uniref:Uncharacterized protein n=1 Tax=Glossina austeni TaxID=7395 RepID=A0A1A9UK26_GLOAU
MNFFRLSTAVIATVVVVETALYRFVTEDHDIFRACSDRAGVGGPSDFADFSGTDIFYDDEGIHMNGSAIILWDVKRTDRVSVIYRHKPFVLKAEGNALVPMEGRYKIVIIFRAFDENNTLTSKCLLIKCLLVLLTCPAFELISSLNSLSTQHDHIMPPEHKSTGLPPLKTQDIERPHSNFLPRYLQRGCGQAAYKPCQRFSKASRNRNEINYFGKKKKSKKFLPRMPVRNRNSLGPTNL